jgi:hypothetical protein
VREIYEANNNTLLLVTSDRISAYDVILKNGVRHKGAVLTLITNYWLNTVLPTHVPGLKHHLISLNIPPTLNIAPEEKQRVWGRSMIVNKYRVFPVEAIGLPPRQDHSSRTQLSADLCCFSPWLYHRQLLGRVSEKRNRPWIGSAKRTPAMSGFPQWPNIYPF